MQARLSIVAAFAVVLGVAACGGGGGSTGGGSLPQYGGSTATPAPTATAMATATPAVTPSPTPSAAPQGIPGQGTAGGAAAWTNPTNGYTLYQLSADGNDASVCTSGNGCTGVWPPLIAPAGSVGNTDFTIFARGDGTNQWAYQGHPLYTYAGDGGAGQNNGNGIVSFGGTWSTSRPAGAVTPTPSPTPASCSGPYC